MHSESTANLGLPQWKPEDHPEWIGDMNPAFEKLDGTYGEISGDMPNVKKQLEQLQALTQSQQEDLTQLQQQAAQLAVRVGITEQDTSKIAGLQEQITNAAAGVAVNLEKIQALEDKINASKALQVSKGGAYSQVYENEDGTRSLTTDAVTRTGDVIRITLSNHTPNGFTAILSADEYNQLLAHVGIDPTNVIAIDCLSMSSEFDDSGACCYLIGAYPYQGTIRFISYSVSGGEVSKRGNIVLKILTKEAI